MQKRYILKPKYKKLLESIKDIILISVIDSYILIIAFILWGLYLDILLYIHIIISIICIIILTNKLSK